MKNFWVSFVICIIILGCSKEDGNNDDTFFSGNDTNVTEKDIVGTWAIFAVEFMEEYIEVTPNFSNCGRDHIVFDMQGRYTDFVYDKFDCMPAISSANWKVDAGVIVVTDASGESDKIPILNASPSELVLKYRFDFDDDGTLDNFKAFLRPYDPIANNHIANSFKRDLDQPTLLQFDWKPFSESVNFGKYEIYRSIEGSCTMENAELITSIDDVSVTSFVDYNPSSTQDNICYFFKVFSNSGLVGESDLLSEDPKEIVIDQTVILNSPNVEGGNIQLDWTNVNIPYFSHYEIVYANTDGSNLLFHEETSIISIDDIEQNSYTDLDPPFLENPFFSVYVYNIFGSKLASNYEQVAFRRPELLQMGTVHSIAVSPFEQVVYVKGRKIIPEQGEYEREVVLRYNYVYGQVESVTNYDLSTSESTPMKIMASSEGHELVVPQGFDLEVLSMEDLSHSYTIALGNELGIYNMNDLGQTDTGLWLMTDNDNLYVFSKQGQSLNLIDSQVHFETHQSYDDYKLFYLKQDKVLIGHPNEANSVLFTLDNQGMIIEKQTVSIPIRSDSFNTSYYSREGGFIVNDKENNIYSTDTFDIKQTLEGPYYPMGISANGLTILGSVNDPNYLRNPDRNEGFRKEGSLFEISSNSFTQIKTKGYPLMIFENYLGSKISISSAYKVSLNDYDISLFAEELIED